MNPDPATRVVVPNTSARDRLTAFGIGVVLLAFVIFGVIKMSEPNQSANLLVGVVEGKQFTPQREEQVAFSGRKLEGTKTIEGEYVLKVRVEKESRSYDVVVPEWTYKGKQKGDKLEFVRPPSEQR